MCMLKYSNTVAADKFHLYYVSKAKVSYFNTS